MRKIALGLAVLTVTAGAAFAQSETSFTDLDVDTSGELSFEELRVTLPDLTEEAFAAADADSSGGLNSEELEALQTGAATTSEGGTPGVPAGVDASGTDDEEGSPSGGGDADNDGSDGGGSSGTSTDGSSTSN